MKGTKVQKMKQAVARLLMLVLVVGTISVGGPLVGDVSTKASTTYTKAKVNKEIKKLQTSEAELMRKQESGSQANKAAREIIPTTQHILDNYDALSIAEKNRLWKLVLKKATVYRTPDGELSVHIYPKLPK